MCGFQNDDILKTVNGMDLGTNDKALAAYEKLRNSDHFVVAIVRQGVQTTVTIDVDP